MPFLSFLNLNRYQVYDPHYHKNYSDTNPDMDVEILGQEVILVHHHPDH